MKVWDWWTARRRHAGSGLAILLGLQNLTPLLRFFLKRLAIGALTLLVASMLIFAATDLLPGSPASNALGKFATPEETHALNQKLGYDHPLPVRYWNWLSGAVRGDLGASAVGTANAGVQAPIWPLIHDRLLNTFTLALRLGAAARAAGAVLRDVGGAAGGARDRPHDLDRAAGDDLAAGVRHRDAARAALLLGARLAAADLADPARVAGDRPPEAARAPGADAARGVGRLGGAARAGGRDRDARVGVRAGGAAATACRSSGSSAATRSGTRSRRACRCSRSRSRRSSAA